ncbi:MAG: response regulator [Myxococcales bacterium]|nr:response regulator [Myxococcales bacterium]
MKRIFIVEDEAVVALELKDHLRRMGYEVCGHAARGVSALREIPLSAPDLVLMDINLRTGPSGLDVAERLRETIDIPVIFLTAYSDIDIAERASRLRCFSYLVKPYDPRVLRSNIELALGHQEGAAIASERAHVALDVLDALEVQVAVLDGQGVFIAANRAWTAATGLSGGDANEIGQDYLAAPGRAKCEPTGDALLATLTAIRAVLSGVLAGTVIEYGAFASGSPCRYSLRISALPGKRSGVVLERRALSDNGTAVTAAA